MTLNELLSFKQNKPFRAHRPEWHDDYFLTITASGCSLGNKSGEQWANYHLHNEDVLANDWSIIEESKYLENWKELLEAYLTSIMYQVQSCVIILKEMS